MRDFAQPHWKFEEEMNWETIKVNDSATSRHIDKSASQRSVRPKDCWAREAAEAERLEKMLKIENEENASKNDLALAIQNRNKARAGQADSFFDSLIDKYAKKAEKKPAKKTPGSAKKSKRKA